VSTLLAVFAFILGTIIGSFLNVVILRYNTGQGITGRSGCFSCGKTLQWYELIPVVSFIVQRGRCRGCKAKLSWQYPAVELLTGLIFLLVFLKFSFYVLPINYSATFFYLVIWSLLIVILVYDLRHKIIPDGLVYTFDGLTLIYLCLHYTQLTQVQFMWALLAGPILFLPFFLLWLVSGGRWIGLGDAKLVVGFGWTLGIGLGVSAIVLGFWLGAIVSILILVLSKLRLGASELKINQSQLTMKSEIPFAPFLILGFGLVYFFTIDVVGIHSLFQL